MTPQTPTTPPTVAPDWRSPIFRLLVCATLAVPGLAAVTLSAPPALAADMSAAARLMDQAAGGTPPRR